MYFRHLLKQRCQWDVVNVPVLESNVYIDETGTHKRRIEMVDIRITDPQLERSTYRSSRKRVYALERLESSSELSKRHYQTAHTGESRYGQRAGKSCYEEHTVKKVLSIGYE